MDHTEGAARRIFLASALGAGFALAVQPIAAQTLIQTDADGLLAGEVAIGEFPAYRAQPAQGRRFPVVLVVSEIFGVHEHIADLCRRLAKLGYLAIAPDLFQRQGDPRKLTSIQEILANIVSKVPDAEVMADLDATVNWAAANGGNVDRLAMTGFCWGGRINWLYAAHSARLKAAVAWYGLLSGATTERQPQQPLDLVGKLKAPVLGLYAGEDPYITVDKLAAMQNALQQAGAKAELHLYRRAQHGFNADYRPSYDKAAAEDGWRRMLEWFRAHGV
ncbi:MAG: dienelactone hydrolase family protein [Rhodocyclaceae bacterium]|jgi:carboxymethylenebutenolidase|nr:dienelactone hydrolase family protein [Rhodocyclaceae bacterium]